MKPCSKLALVGALIAAAGAHAAEGGGSNYPNGAETYLGAVPPEGLYMLAYGAAYRSDRFNDGNGNQVPIPGFKIAADVVTPRLLWVPGTKVLGGDLVFHTLVPMFHLKASAMGMSQSKSGIGDMTVGGAIGFRHANELNTGASVELTLPTGSYKVGDLANIGRNYRSLETVFAITRSARVGLNADARIGYMFNGTNDATQYKSGQEIHADYTVGWGMANGWTLGVGGYLRKQTTLDEVNGVGVPGSKSSALAIGPAIRYTAENGWMITAKWQTESNVKNAPQGGSLFLKTIIPLR